MDLYNREWILFDCVTGQHRLIDWTPFTIGSGEHCDFQIDDPEVAREHCRIERQGRVYFIVSGESSAQLIFDGVSIVESELSANEDHTLIIGPASLCASWRRPAEAMARRIESPRMVHLR